MSCYEIWSLVIGAIGIIATFSAVIVALWQTKFANKKKLKLRFVEGNATFNPRTNEHKDYVSISITNIGNRKVIVSSWGIKISKTERFLILTEFFDDYFDQAVSVKTPCTLDTEENVCFFYIKEKFVSVLDEQIKNGKINKNKRITFYVFDSTGKEYTVKSNKKAHVYTTWKQA